MTVEVHARGLKLTNFLRGSVQMTMSELVNSFEVEYAAKLKTPGERALFPGDAVEVRVGGQVVIGGYVDGTDDADEEAMVRLRASGRSKTMDLVDCSAAHQGFNQQTVTQIAQALSKPFGVTVRAEGEDTERFPRFHVQKGESVGDAILRAANLRGFWPYAVGADLVVGRAGATTAPGALVRGAPPVMRTARADSWYGRFSDYVFKGQIPATNEAWGAKAGQLKASVRDDAITRYRPLMIQVQGHGTGDLETRASVVRNQRAGQGERVSLTLSGHTMQDGKPWRPNVLVSVDNEVLGIKDTLLIETVRMRFGEAEADTTELELMSPGAFDIGRYKALRGRGKWWKA